MNINNEIDLSSLEHAQNPYKTYEILRKKGNVHYLEKNDIHLVLSHNLCTKILNNPKDFSSEASNSFDPILLNCDPPKHTFNRRLLQGKHGIFSQKRINSDKAKIEEIALKLIETLKNKEDFDFVVDFALPYSSLVIFNLLGLNNESKDKLQKYTNETVLSQSIHNTEYANKQWEELKPIVETHVNEAASCPHSKGLSEIIYHPEAENHFSNEELINLTKVLLVGGNETTPNWLSSAVIILLKNKSLLEELKLNPEKITPFLDEVLRLESPTQIIHRVTTKDIELEGCLIKKNTFISVCIGAANRDPSVFKNPDTFDMNRSLSKSLAFGHGVHHCIGASLAKLEAFTAISLILPHLSNLQIKKSSQLKYRHSSHIRGLEALSLTTEKINYPKISKFKEKIYAKIEAELSLNGSIKTYEFYPNFELKKDKGWHYTHPSPFIHANVAYALLNYNSKESSVLVDKMFPFLKKTKEKGDLWRFWNLDNCEISVPLDVDDTAISSFLLNKKGVSLNNKEILKQNIKKDGSVLTWISPSFKLVFKKPSLFFKLIKETPKVLPTIFGKMLSYKDHELGVTANFLMYYGENEETKQVIQHCIDSWKNNNIAFNFYERKIVIAYHIARAYKEGIHSFKILALEIEKMITNEFENYSYAELLLAALTLQYFELEEDTYKKVKVKILEEASEETIFEQYPYFTSKDRVFFAGSPLLTASWFLEFTNDL